MKNVRMKAVVYTEYGKAEVLKLKNIDKPTPKANEVLIKMNATTVNSGDIVLRKADPFGVRLFFGLLRPKINVLGSTFSGQVEAIGSGVTRYKVGDEVFGSTDMQFGSYAEYLCQPETGAIALKPVNMTHPEAAAIPFGGVTALYFLKKAKIRTGQNVLINGASGAVGSAAVQLAKYLGAHVTAVCGTSGVEMVKAIGADEVIDYTREDLGKNILKYDVVYDTVNKLPVSVGIRLLKKNGTLILGAAGMAEMLKSMFYSIGGTKIVKGLIKKTGNDIAFLRDVIEEDKMRAVIDSTYRMSQIVEAHKHVEKGHKQGNVVMTMI